MAKIQRYEGNLQAFASAATGQERVIFGNDDSPPVQSDDLTTNINSNFARGWGVLPLGNKPPREWFNSVAFAATQLSAYQHQVGVPEWDDEQEYHEGSLVNSGAGLMLSLAADNVGGALESGAGWGQYGALSVETFSQLESLAPTSTGSEFICRERGGAKYILQADGYDPDFGDVTFTNGRVGALVYGNEITVNHFGPLTSATLQGVFDLSGKYSKVSAQAGSDINLDTDVVVFDKGRPDDFNFLIDFSGCSISGTGGFVFDSCKNLTVNGLHNPNSHITLRGVWFSEFNSCKASELRLLDQLGTTYSSCYWNTFNNCIMQHIVKGDFDEPTNAFFFYGCSFRGNSGQGFDSDYDYWLTTDSNSGNMQQWCFYGGDISYYQEEVLNVVGDKDLEILFDGVYWDSLVPKESGLSRDQWVEVRHGHIAGRYAGGQPLSQAGKSSSQFRGNQSTAGWQSFAPLNLIPNGDFSQALEEQTSDYGGPISSGGTITVMENSFDRYIRLQTVGAEACFFRSVDLPVTGVYSGTIILKSANFQEQEVRFSVGGQFFNALIGTEWTVVNSGSLDELTGGSSQTIRVFSQAGNDLDLHVRYIGLTLGSHPPFMCPQHPRAQTSDTLRTNILELGGLQNNAVITSGEGSPEGVVEARVGSMYTDVNGSSGSTLYVKESGTGNTGWVAK